MYYALQSQLPDADLDHGAAQAHLPICSLRHLGRRGATVSRPPTLAKLCELLPCRCRADFMQGHLACCPSMIMYLVMNCVETYTLHMHFRGAT